MSGSQHPRSAPGVAARISAVATHLPAQVLTNDALAGIFETWSADKIYEKTGIAERRIAANDETALDLGVAAAERLFVEQGVPRESVDFVIFCTQAPDYFLPSSACILQDRLGLPKSTGALDITLGCSGFVYGLSLAVGQIAGGMAKRVLLVTADTYSKFIHPMDRSVRTLFGDGATATLVDAVEGDDVSSIGPFVFGTDGRGAHELIVETGAARQARTPETGAAVEDEFGNVRSRDNLFMNGSAVMNFTLREVPSMYRELKERVGYDDADIDLVVMHQANQFMLDALRKKMKLPSEKVPYHFEKVGNTVSSTIPFVLAQLRDTNQLAAGQRIALLGFGVGLSWAGCLLTV